MSLVSEELHALSCLDSCCRFLMRSLKETFGALDAAPARDGRRLERLGAAVVGGLAGFLVVGDAGPVKDVDVDGGMMLVRMGVSCGRIKVLRPYGDGD
jgi:hypothetical protein